MKERTNVTTIAQHTSGHPSSGLDSPSQSARSPVHARVHVTDGRRSRHLVTLSLTAVRSGRCSLPLSTAGCLLAVLGDSLLPGFVLRDRDLSLACSTLREVNFIIFFRVGHCWTLPFQSFVFGIYQHGRRSLWARWAFPFACFF